MATARVATDADQEPRFNGPCHLLLDVGPQQLQSGAHCDSDATQRGGERQCQAGEAARLSGVRRERHRSRNRLSVLAAMTPLPLDEHVMVDTLERQGGVSAGLGAAGLLRAGRL